MSNSIASNSGASNSGASKSGASKSGASKSVASKSGAYKSVDDSNSIVSNSVVSQSVAPKSILSKSSGKKQAGSRMSSAFEKKVTAVVQGSTDTSDPMSALVQEAYEGAQLGYAYMSFANNNDLDLGPEIQIGKINPRVPTSKKIKKLYESTNFGKTVVNNTPENAILICLPKSYVKLESLSMNSTNAQFVQWAPHAHKGVADKAWLANGLHRWWMVMSHLCKAEIITWEQVKGHYSAVVGGNNQTAIDKTQKMLHELTVSLCERSKWLVLFFDIDLIIGTSLEGQLKQRLGANTMRYRNEDLQSEMLWFIIHQLNEHPEEQYETILHNYLDHHVSSENNRRKMVFGCPPGFFKVLVDLFSFEFMASSDFITVTTIYSWTAVMLAFWMQYLMGVHDDLVFLVTPHSLPDYNQVLAASESAGSQDVKTDIFKATRGEYVSATKGLKYKHLTFILDDNFFQILNVCYLEKIEPLREAVGCGRSDVIFEPYNEAFEDYKVLFMEKMEEWMVERRAQLEAEGRLKEDDVKAVVVMTL